MKIKVVYIKLVITCLLVNLTRSIVFWPIRQSLGSRVSYSSKDTVNLKTNPREQNFTSSENFIEDSKSQCAKDFDNPERISKENEDALNILTRLVSSSDGWLFVSRKNNVIVEKRFLGAGPYVSVEDAAKGSKHICIKSSGIIKAPPEAVFNLFVDNSRVSEYNEHCTRMKDICKIPAINANKKSDYGTKLTWACGPKYGPLKPRDFCSVVHYIKYDNGTSIILNRPAYDARCRPTNKFVRATILLAGNIIQPFGNGCTRITQIAHINPG